MTRVENGHRDTLEMLNVEKDKIMGTLQVTLQKECDKMEQLHKSDLENKEKTHTENTQTIKVQL